MAITDTRYGACFKPAYACSHDEVERVLDAIGVPERSDIIYHSDQLDIFRFFWQTRFYTMLTFNLVFVAQRINEDDIPLDEYIVVAGTINTTKYGDEPECERVGKRMLHKATKEMWNITY